MLVERNGVVPQVDPGASVAPTAAVVGDVAIAAGCYLGHGPEGPSVACYCPSGPR
jgi:carbonic anhydrase/acetyltransferase-like protein (isoleucine patch superfamily)